MALKEEEIKSLKDVLKNSLRNKFANYNPEPASMPFHTRLLGKDRLALYQFIHSLNTNFGVTIFEPVAISLAQNNFKNALKQVHAANSLTEKALFEIQSTMDGLITATISPDKEAEIERLRKVCREGVVRTVHPTNIDIYLKSADEEIYLIDLKTAKPNFGNFKEYKRTLLEWVAVTLYENPKAKVNSLIAIPYNPYEPQPYNRWTMKGILDLKHELKVAKEFWDFLGGKGAYEVLLDCFEQVGIEMREEIDKYFSRFK